jgi:hypothetical protein
MWQFHWILSLIPDSIFVWFTYVLFALGVILYVASKLVAWIPFIAQYKFPAEIIGVALLVVGAYVMGGRDTELAWRARVNEMQAKIDTAEQAAKDANGRIQTQIVTKIQYIKENVNANNQAIEAKRNAINAECRLSDDAWVLYNRAIKNEVAGRTSGTATTSN